MIQHLTNEQLLHIGKMCRQQRPAIEQKRTWTIEDFYTLMMADATLIDGEVHYPMAALEQLAFDTRTPKELLPKMQQFLVLTREMQDKPAKEQAAAIEKLFAT